MIGERLRINSGMSSGKRTKIGLVLPGIRSYLINEHESVRRQHLLRGKHGCNSAIRGSSKSGRTAPWKHKSLPGGTDEQLWLHGWGPEKVRNFMFYVVTALNLPPTLATNPQLGFLLLFRFYNPSSSRHLGDIYFKNKCVCV